MKPHWTNRLPADACKDAVKWCRTRPSLAAAWRRCERGDWMLWLLGRLDVDRPIDRHGLARGIQRAIEIVSAE